MASFKRITDKEAKGRYAKSRIRPQTKQMIEWVEFVKKEGGIGVLTPGRGESLTALRNRVRRAASLSGIEVDTQQDGEELLFRVSK